MTAKSPSSVLKKELSPTSSTSKAKVSEILISVALGMITGMMPEWLSGAMVMNHYRKLDEEQTRKELHIKYLEETAMHVSKVLNEVDLLIHRDGPPDYDNILRKIRIFQILDGKLDETTALLEKIEKKIKENTLNARQAAIELIKLSAKLMVAMDTYRREKLQ